MEVRRVQEVRPRKEEAVSLAWVERGEERTASVGARGSSCLELSQEHYYWEESRATRGVSSEETAGTFGNKRHERPAGGGVHDVRRGILPGAGRTTEDGQSGWGAISGK